jgi:hypothetical protein
MTNKYDDIQTWNRLGYTNIPGAEDGRHVEDWNQTLITVINQSQVRVFQKTHRFGADKVITSIKNKKLFDTFNEAAYDKTAQIIGNGRYKVEFRDDVPESLIMVTCSKNIDLCSYIVLHSDVSSLIMPSL